MKKGNSNENPKLLKIVGGEVYTHENENLIKMPPEKTIEKTTRIRRKTYRDTSNF